MSRQNTNKPRKSDNNPWPHRMAWALALATFPLIWMGGLVTTYEAGMAVPDWPNTYGYNLFLYPLESWLAVWDIFLEHSHRLLGAAVGMITIALAVLLWIYDQRKWMRLLAVAAVLGVCVQGVLGGLRVLGDERLLAKIHGSTGPLFFGLAAALVTLTSRRWRLRDQRSEHRSAPGTVRSTVAWSPWSLRRLTPVCLVGVYLQIVLGAQLRHVAPDAGPGWFALWVWLHLIVAAVVLIAILWLWILASRRFRAEAMILRRARLLTALFLLQVVLGGATWLTNYGWPAWFTDYIWELEYTVVAEGPLQAVTTTLHVGAGSLNLVAALSLALWSRRLTSASAPRRRHGRG